MINRYIRLMLEIAIGARAHHERPDGKGYPYGMNGDEIPRVAIIIAVADYFDAMYSNRPYRERMNFDKTMDNSANDGRVIIAMSISDYMADTDESLNDVFIGADSQMYKRKNELKQFAIEEDNYDNISRFTVYARKR